MRSATYNCRDVSSVACTYPWPPLTLLSNILLPNGFEPLHALARPVDWRPPRDIQSRGLI
eukprot:1027198-Amphidinium_carterae.1